VLATADNLPSRLGLVQPAGPSGFLTIPSHRHPRQISPSKNMNFPCTTAAFTLSTVSVGLRHGVLTCPQTGPSMQFLFVGSHICHRASFGQFLADLPLPPASGYPCNMLQVGYSHRGLSPLQFMPMSGAHSALNATPFLLRSPWRHRSRRALALR
jgi:hypothetical protein